MYITPQLIPGFESIIPDDWDADSYQTPSNERQPIAQKIANLITPSDREVLEPSAGAGQIAQFLPKGSTCMEIKKSRVAQGKERASHCQWIEGDFLAWETEQRFDAIVGNPPFSLAMPFVEKSLTLLNPHNPVARILFLLPLNFNCPQGQGAYWDTLPCHIFHTYRIRGRVHFLGRNGIPEMKRQCDDAVFDIRLGKQFGADSFL